MKHYRIKYIKYLNHNEWWVQYRWKFLWLIPTPFWVSTTISYYSTYDSAYYAMEDLMNEHKETIVHQQ